jgi:hypothetical protein
VHHARHQPLEQLLLPEHDHRFVLDTARQVVEALSPLRRADKPRQEEGAAREEPARDRQRGGKR